MHQVPGPPVRQSSDVEVAERGEVGREPRKVPGPSVSEEQVPSGSTALSVVLLCRIVQPVFGVEERWWARGSKGSLCPGMSSQLATGRVLT